jgi:Tfp pilus assembly protein PilP
VNQSLRYRSAFRMRLVGVTRQVAAVVLAGFLVPSCGEDEPVPVDPVKANAAKKKIDTPEAKKGDAADGADGDDVKVRPAERPPRVLTHEDFGPHARDPFQTYQAPELVGAPVEPDHVRQRDVRMPNYDFEDLRLIAIVRSGASIRPRALFVGNDGISKPITQGEYFSRNEVMLATVNSDYIEIEIVDEELAKGLNMTRGERRAIYLKRE